MQSSGKVFIESSKVGPRGGVEKLKVKKICDWGSRSPAAVVAVVAQGVGASAWRRRELKWVSHHVDPSTVTFVELP